MRRSDIPHLPGVLDPDEIRATGDSIAAAQTRTGVIPWVPGGLADPWDHVECAMALSAAGQYTAAVGAYAWLARTQRPDGTWPSLTRGRAVLEAHPETNRCAYIAVGVWHHLLITGDVRFARRMWPAVRAAIAFVTAQQAPRGEIAWSTLDSTDRGPQALLTGCSSIYHSIRAALALADHMGEPQADWEIAAGQLRHALRAHPEAFLDKSRFSMDWYYPVLGGVFRGRAGRRRLSNSWDVFVVGGLGVRCVSDQPWVTGAETCELALALEAVGDSARARELIAAMQHLRTEDGSYWTGYQFSEDLHWPDERSTWTGATVILAVDALSGSTPGSGIFRGDTLPAIPEWRGESCGCKPDALPAPAGA